MTTKSLSRFISIGTTPTNETKMIRVNKCLKITAQ